MPTLDVLFIYLYIDTPHTLKISYLQNKKKDVSHFRYTFIKFVKVEVQTLDLMSHVKIQVIYRENVRIYFFLSR